MSPSTPPPRPTDPGLADPRAGEDPSAPVLVTRGLVRRFGEAVAVDGLDLEIHRGDCLGLLGPNGAGKSTTVRILSTLLAPSSGEIRILGLDPVSQGEAVRARIGVVPQEIAVYGHLSARENLTFFARLQGAGSGSSLEAAVERGLEIAGLKDRAGDLVRTFSGGMKRRLNVAVALVHRPEVVFLDEPTVGIDPQSRNRIFEIVEDLRGQGTTMIYTSHQLGEVERLCDRIVILDHGRKIAEGTLAELQVHPGVRQDGAASLRFDDEEAARRAAELLRERGLAPALEVDRPDLERVFLALTGHALRDEGGS